MQSAKCKMQKSKWRRESNAAFLLTPEPQPLTLNRFLDPPRSRARLSAMPRVRRILLLAERFPPEIGGSARSAARSAAALAEMGMEVDVLCWTRRLPGGAVESASAADPGSTSPTAPPALPPGVSLHRLGLYANWDLSLQHTLNVLDWLHGSRRFDAVWGHYLYPAGFAAVLFAKSAGIPCTVSARGNDVDRLVFPPGDFSRLLWTLERADVITAASRDLAKKIGVLLGRDPGVEVLHNVVCPETFSPGLADESLRARLGILPGEAVLCFSGELRHKKGAEFLLAALRDVRRARPACLLIIGEARSEESARLAAFAADAPEDGARVIVTGHLENPTDVATHLRLCDVFLHPSLWDGMPNALLEAMACGKIPLASDAGGIPEIIEPGISGSLLPRAQLHRLGEAAIELLSLPTDQRRKMERAARQRVLTAFHPSAEASSLKRVMGRLAETFRK
ncbi:MAG: pimB [Phycisphaerales bacterium]|nr:pimB [Phycisphaerales bacterium]